METPKFVREYLNTLEQERERMGISVEELSELSGVRKDILAGRHRASTTSWRKCLAGGTVND